MSKRQSDKGAFKELCVGYVLNILEQDERELFERMLDDATDEQRALYERMRTKANELMFSDLENTEPEDLKEQLLAEIDEGDEDSVEVTSVDSKDITKSDDVEHVAEEKEQSGGSYAVVSSIALGFICLSLIFYSFTLRSEINALEDEIAEQEEHIDEISVELDDQEQMLAILGSRQLQTVPLLGMEENPFGYGNVLWDAQNLRALVQVGELSTPSSDMEYQLWAISDNKATAVRQFSVDSDGEARFLVDSIDALKDKSEFSFAVTLEPAGGSDQPNGDMYLMGSVGD